MEKEYLSALIKNCIGNDAKSIEILYKTYYGYIKAITLRYLNNKLSAEETTNDAFIKVLTHLTNYDASKSFKSWISKITVNCCLDILRKNKSIYTDDISDIHIAEKDNIDNQLNFEYILSLLQLLPTIQRVIFNMYEIEGYSHQEISKKLKLNESTSRTYLTRAKKKLKTLVNIPNKKSYV